MPATQRHLQVLKIMEKRAPAAKTWAQQWDELKTMWLAGVPADEIAEKLGRSESAVMTQATRLGLGRREAPGRKATAPREVQIRNTNVIAFKPAHPVEAAEAPRHEKKERDCLMCGPAFMSHGSHNRICPHCKAGAAYQAACNTPHELMTA